MMPAGAISRSLASVSLPLRRRVWRRPPSAEASLRARVARPGPCAPGPARDGSGRFAALAPFLRAGEYGDAVPAVTGCSEADLRVVDCSAELLRARVDVPLEADALRVALPAFVTRRDALFCVAGLSSVSRGALVAPAVRVPRPAAAPRFALPFPASLTDAWRRPGVPRPAWVSPAAVRLVAPLPPADLRAVPLPFAPDACVAVFFVVDFCVVDFCVADLLARPPAEAAFVAPAPAAFFVVLVPVAPADFVLLPAAAPEDAADDLDALLRRVPLSVSSWLPASLRAEVRFAVDLVPLLPAWVAGLERPPVFVAMGVLRIESGASWRTGVVARDSFKRGERTAPGIDIWTMTCRTRRSGGRMRCAYVDPMGPQAGGQPAHSGRAGHEDPRRSDAGCDR